jgi:radical SAM enzyme (TIGR01210 family)
MSAPGATAYPAAGRERDRWIADRRPARNAVDTGRPHAFLLERERAENGGVVDVATLFLTGRECPWRCLMCDLWKNTTETPTPAGAIPTQLDFALRELGRRHPGRTPRQIKLYNSGSFFDRAAVPVDDYEAIARRVAPFARVIVESHPALIGDATLRFRDLLDRGESSGPRLEVAMGLETAHPDVLEKLNKRFTLDDFSRAAGTLRREEIALRVFVLLKPPFMAEEEGVEWAVRSADFAFDCGATVVSLIPTRPGNGALEALADEGHYSPPQLGSLEAALERCLRRGRGRVFADLWDLEKFSACAVCLADRRQRLEQMNLGQQVVPRVTCDRCAI